MRFILPIDQLVTYYGHDLKGANLPFNFQLLQTAWNAASIARIMEEYEAALPSGAWPNWVLGNHDKRSDRFENWCGPGAGCGDAAAHIARHPDHLLRGGNWDEGCSHSPDQVQDPAEKNEPGLGLGRDPSGLRCPGMVAPCGLYFRKPWLPLGADHAISMWKSLRENRRSILSLYRRLMDLRRDNPAYTQGPFIR